MIDSKIFKQIKFESNGVVDLYNKVSYKVPTGYVIQSDYKQLCIEISRIAKEKQAEQKEKIGVYALILDRCAIPSDTFKKMINGKRRFTRSQLAKFCVGFKLSLEEANILFRLESGELNLTNDFDFIVYHALDDKDDIHYFMSEVSEYLGINLDNFF